MHKIFSHVLSGLPRNIQALKPVVSYHMKSLEKFCAAGIYFSWYPCHNIPTEGLRLFCSFIFFFVDVLGTSAPFNFASLKILSVDFVQCHSRLNYAFLELKKKCRKLCTFDLTSFIWDLKCAEDSCWFIVWCHSKLRGQQ